MLIEFYSFFFFFAVGVTWIDRLLRKRRKSWCWRIICWCGFRRVDEVPAHTSMDRIDGGAGFLSDSFDVLLLYLLSEKLFVIPVHPLPRVLLTHFLWVIDLLHITSYHKWIINFIPSTYKKKGREKNNKLDLEMRYARRKGIQQDIYTYIQIS